MDLLKSDFVLLLADTMLTVVLLKGTLVAGAVALVALTVRRSSAAVHAGIWTLAFGALVGLFAAWCAMPWWSAAILRFPDALFRTAESAHPALEAARQALGDGAAPPGAIALELAGVPIASYIAALWVAGALLLTARLVAQRLTVERMANAGRPVLDRHCLTLADRISAELGISRQVRLIYCDDVEGPAVFGIRRPAVLLPDSAASWPADRLEAVLRHELAHVQRHDYAALMLIELVRIVYWINPFVELAARQARVSQDRACDDAALRSGMSPQAYASHLVDTARALGARCMPLGALPLVRGVGLRARIAAILTHDSDRAPLPARTLLRWSAVTVLATAAFGSANLWICESEYDPPSSAVAVPASSGPLDPTT
jgi:beta-lactamase regulating signal transducer with metallopeptidase domain